MSDDRQGNKDKVGDCVNNVMVFGRLVKKPELKTAKNGAPYCTFIVAVKRQYGKPSNTNRKKETTDVDFLDCIAWNNIARNIRKYAVKGGLVLLQGELQTFVRQLSSGAYMKKYYVYVKELNLVNWRKPEQELQFDEVEAAQQPSAFELAITESMIGYTQAHKRKRPLPDITISDKKLAGFDGDPDMPDLYSAEEYGIQLGDDDLDDYNDYDMEGGEN